MPVVRMISDHPFVAVAVCFVLLVVLYFCFKKLIKLALIVLVVALAIGGYFYFEYPDQRPADMTEALEKARAGTGKAMEKGKDVVEKGRELVSKGPEAVEKGREMVDKGKSFLERAVERGEAFVAKVKKAAREIGKIFKEE